MTDENEPKSTPTYLEIIMAGIAGFLAGGFFYAQMYGQPTTEWMSENLDKLYCRRDPSETLFKRQCFIVREFKHKSLNKIVNDLKQKRRENDNKPRGDD